MQNQEQQQSLKYLFIAIYKDATVYKQNPEDKSLTKENGSSFSDVDHEKLRAFVLVDQSGTGNQYAVSLVDGHFEINGIIFTAHDERNLTNFRLIFFRRHLHQFQITEQSTKEDFHKCFYRIGWQANNEKGENVQRILEFT